MSASKINQRLIEKYANRYAYMYAQYPNNNYWTSDVGEADYHAALRGLGAYKANAPTLLYVHFPFCAKICHFCSCYRVLAPNYDRASLHLSHILKEMEMVAAFLEAEGLDAGIGQVHFGGGSPTYLNNEDFDRFAGMVHRLAAGRTLQEFAIEIDPRHVTPDRMRYYSQKGINRISFGIQDFDENVQTAVNRPQPEALIKTLLAPDIRSLFPSVSFDILHGLPKQTLNSFAQTMQTVLELAPDRVVLLTFNFSPEQNRNQKNICSEDLPGALEKAEMSAMAAEMLINAGYLQVGLEHFVRPHDKLAALWRTGDFNWNMSGYNQGDANKIIAFGPHSVSRITDDYYFQNLISLNDYEAAVSAGKLPLLRGCKLTPDQKLRRDVTIGLRSRLRLRFSDIEKKHNIDFRSYFASELGRLKELEAEGIITVSDDELKATEDGMNFISFACMEFDKYHQQAADSAD